MAESEPNPVVADVRLFQHLLPNGRSFRITVSKYLRSFFESLYLSLQYPLRERLDTVLADLYPRSTSLEVRWQETLGIMYPYGDAITELEAEWSALGVSTLADIQAALQARGFDVYVHEAWYEDHGDYLPRNPLDYLWPSTIAPSPVPPGLGYPLVNKIYTTDRNYSALCDEEGIECGELEAECGYFQYSVYNLKLYTIPEGMGFWPFFVYVGGEVFGEFATIDPERREEFEDTCLRLFPAQQWLGILVQYYSTATEITT